MSNIKKSSVQTTTFLLLDSFGNTASATIEDLSDSVYLPGLQNANNDLVYFSGTGYGIEIWAQDYGIEVKKIVRTYDFETLWNQTT